MDDTVDLPVPIICILLSAHEIQRVHRVNSRRRSIVSAWIKDPSQVARHAGGSQGSCEQAARLERILVQGEADKASIRIAGQLEHDGERSDPAGSVPSRV